MTDRDNAIGLDAPRLVAEVLVDLDTDLGVVRAGSSNNAIRITSEDPNGLQLTYIAAGGLFEIAPLQESSAVDGTGFAITIEGANYQLQREALETNLSDKDIRLWLAIQRPGTTQSPPTWRRYVIKRGKVSNVILASGHISIEAYTPMTSATRPRGFATQWTDDQQRHYVDNDDYIFRYLAANSEKEIIL